MKFHFILKKKQKKQPHAAQVNRKQISCTIFSLAIEGLLHLKTNQMLILIKC